MKNVRCEVRSRAADAAPARAWEKHFGNGASERIRGACFFLDRTKRGSFFRPCPQPKSRCGEPAATDDRPGRLTTPWHIGCGLIGAGGKATDVLSWYDSGPRRAGKRYRKERTNRTNRKSLRDEITRHTSPGPPVTRRKSRCDFLRHGRPVGSDGIMPHWRGFRRPL